MSKKILYKQHDLSDCGAACLASVSSHYGYHTTISGIRQNAGTSRSGTNLLGMIEAAEKLGLQAKGVRLEKQHLNKLPLPSIAHLNISDKWLHFVVVYKVTEDRVEIMDPARGDIIKKPIIEFNRDWTGVALILAPGNNFTKGNSSPSVTVRFLKLIQPHKSILGIAFLGSVLYSILGISTSIYVEKLLDIVIPSGSFQLLNTFSLILLTIILLKTLIGYLKSIMILKTGQKIDAMLILGYFKHLLKLPSVFFHNMRTGEIISRVNDAVKIRHFINNVAMELIVNLLIIIFTLSMMALYSTKIFILVLCSFPLYFLIWYQYNHFNKIGLRKTMEDSAELESQLVESVKGIETIKKFGLEQMGMNKIQNSFLRFLETSLSIGKNSIFTGNISEVVSGIVLLLIFWFGTSQVFKNNITTGELLSFFTLFSYLAGPLNSFLLSNRNIQDALIAADRLFQIMDLDAEEKTTNRNEIKFSKPISIHVSNVSFRYPAKDFLLKDTSFYLESPGIYGIVGESGTGKSSLLSLLLRYEKRVAGDILISGNSIDQIRTEDLKKIIAIVPQNIFLFTGTIASNIALGDDDPDFKKINAMMKDLGLFRLNGGEDKQLNSIIIENGNNMSGGEKQKIAIARALYREPRILLMDEPGSALDYKSEQNLIEMINRLREKGLLIIIVAHRLSTIVNADRIFVLKNKCISEEGTHQELLHKEGDYFELWKSQFHSPASLVRR